MNRAVFLLWVLLLSNIAYAQLIPANSHQQVIDIAMQNYWGKARLQDGSPVQPASEKERITTPIAFNNASDVIRIGELSSLAKWCGLEWQSNYRKATNGARNFGLTGKQVAFVGLLHGVSMGIVNDGTKGISCSPAQKESIKTQLKRISNNPIDFELSARPTVYKLGYEAEPSTSFYTDPSYSGLVGVRPYPNPDDVCLVIGENSLTAELMDDKLLLIACPKHEEGALADRIRDGARVINHAKHWTLLHMKSLIN